MTAAAHVVLSGLIVEWGGEPVFVRKGTVLMVDPASAHGAAFGGPSNLGDLPSWQAGEDADHSCLGN